MNINAADPPGSYQGSGKEMNLSSVLIYMNVCSPQKNSIGPGGVNTEEADRGKLGLSPPASAH